VQTNAQFDPDAEVKNAGINDHIRDQGVETEDEIDKKNAIKLRTDTGQDLGQDRSQATGIIDTEDDDFQAENDLRDETIKNAITDDPTTATIGIDLEVDHMNEATENQPT